MYVRCVSQHTQVICRFFLVSVVADSTLCLGCVRYSLKEDLDRMDVVFIGTELQKQDAPEKFNRTILWGPDYPEKVVPALQALDSSQRDSTGKSLYFMHLTLVRFARLLVRILT